MTTPVERFLDDLNRSPQGQIILANMLDSVEANLVTTSFVKSFLESCVNLHAADPAESCLVIFSEASKLQTPTDEPIYLRKSKSTGTPRDGDQWTNTVAWSSWWTHHADRLRIDAEYGLAIPPISGGVTRAQMPSAKAYLSEVTSKPNWWHPVKGNLGLPLPSPSNCWLSGNAFFALGSVGSSLDAATEKRDALGLIGTTAGAVLVTYTFSAATARSAISNDLARPNFADLGNSRFKAYNKESAAVTYATGDWGCTAHLEKFARGMRTDTTGMPERVSRRLPIKDLSLLTVEVIGYVACSRGVTPKDDDLAFARHLLRRRKPQTILKKLARMCK